jgi:hypothetical protein
MHISAVEEMMLYMMDGEEVENTLKMVVPNEATSRGDKRLYESDNSNFNKELTHHLTP